MAVEANRGGVLSAEEIRLRLAIEPPLVRGYPTLDDQLQPNGFDLTLAEIHRHEGRGTIGVSNAERVLSSLSLIHI